MDDAKLYSWFLGPKAENGDILEQLILEALRDTIFWRRNFHPEDESLITQAVKREEAFQDSVSLLQEQLLALLAHLKREIPFFSPRYIGHMLGDQLLPAVLGYFAAMLHNPNNVSSEGSPITTAYELEVAQQLARLLGYAQGAWGHITSGGTLANIEALWVARNLKYFPLAAKRVALEWDLSSVPITTCQGAKMDLLTKENSWALLNLDPDEVLEIRSKLCKALAERESNLSIEAVEERVDRELARHTLSGTGLHRFFHEFDEDSKPASVLMSATAHYSLQKAVEVLGLGKNQIEFIPVDSHFRMDMGALRASLETHLKERRPIIALVSLLGSTEEGSVDYLHEIVAIQEKYRSRGINFYHHCDAAWGGYVRCLFHDRNNKPVEDPGPIMKRIGLWPPDEVFKSFSCSHRTDSVTIDPHKLGYIPYPCGAVVFRNERVRDLISFDAPYLFRTKGANHRPFIGRYILEGSKPGAAAAACWLAHRVVPLNQDGYGELIGRSIQGAQELYLKCSRDLAVELERSGITLHALTDPPDINLFCFLVNIDGNRSLQKMNDLNQRIYGMLKFRPQDVIQQHEFIISSTDFLFSQYGRRGSSEATSMDNHLRSVGIAPEEFPKVGSVTVLRCTVIGPWLALARGGKPDFVTSFASVLKEKILKAANELP